MFGLQNIADGAPDAAGGYPQLSAEYIVGQAPDLIVLADTKCCGQTAETVAQRPAFDTVPAVRTGRCSPPTTTSPPAGARGSPTSPSRSPAP